jgi:hypothetical protein
MTALIPNSTQACELVIFLACLVGMVRSRTQATEFLVLWDIVHTHLGLYFGLLDKYQHFWDKHYIHLQDRSEEMEVMSSKMLVPTYHTAQCHDP